MHSESSGILLSIQKWMFHLFLAVTKKNYKCNKSYLWSGTLKFSFTKLIKQSLFLHGKEKKAFQRIIK